MLSKDSLVYYAFLAFLARRFSLRVFSATFFELLPPLSLFAIGVLQTGDRSGSRETSLAHRDKPQPNRSLTTSPIGAVMGGRLGLLLRSDVIGRVWSSPLLKEAPWSWIRRS